MTQSYSEFILMNLLPNREIVLPSFTGRKRGGEA